MNSLSPALPIHPHQPKIPLIPSDCSLTEVANLALPFAQFLNPAISFENGMNSVKTQAMVRSVGSSSDDEICCTIGRTRDRIPGVAVKLQPRS